MPGPDLKSRQKVRVECYSGYRSAQYPKRVELDGRWFEIFKVLRHEVVEDYHTHNRADVYHCHIGDNIIIRLMSNREGWFKI
ncbi:MAG: hypothetical protein ABIL05_05250 [candidate division WOR-3 bacterium]